MTNHIAYHTDETSTVPLAEGAELTDFRGETWIFKAVSRGPSEGRSAKVIVHLPGDSLFEREFYSTVFPGLEVN